MPLSPPALTALSRDLAPRTHGADFPPNFETAPVPPTTHPAPTLSPNLASRRRLTTHLLHIHAYLTIFSILGTLARLGLSALTSYAGAPFPGSGAVVWANVAGCVLMGMLVEEEHASRHRQQPWWVGLTTGLCGSVTSFSSFVGEAFELMLKGGESPGTRFMSTAAYLLATVALAMAALAVGGHVAGGVRGGKGLRLRLRLLPLGALAAGMWAGAIAACALLPRWRGTVLFALVFAPTGAYARFWLSRLLNPARKSFPLGTFACNVGGCAILAGMVVGRGRVPGVGCQALRGVQDGFCGCLSTVSTWVVELRGLRTRQAYVYGAGSVAAGLAVVVGVQGGWVWGTGGGPEMC